MSNRANNSLVLVEDGGGLAASLVATHEAASDPHPDYETSVEAQAKVDAHANLTNNPHSVTKSQVGLGNVDNTSDADKPISTANQGALDAHANLTNNPHSVTKSQVGLGDVDNTSDADKPISTATQGALDAHANLTNNPHSVTKSQVGLGDVDNTSDADKPISTATQGALDLKVSSNTTGVTGADAITNMMSLTQAEYDAITPNASTFYVIV